MPNRSEFQIQHDSLGRRISNKGVRHAVRFAKRVEAEERNSHTAPDKRRSYWRERGFTRESHAAAVVRNAVAEGNVISKTIIPEV